MDPPDIGAISIAERFGLAKDLQFFRDVDYESGVKSLLLQFSGSNRFFCHNPLPFQRSQL
jgi:hypothetical protein